MEDHEQERDGVAVCVFHGEIAGLRDKLYGKPDGPSEQGDIASLHGRINERLPIGAAKVVIGVICTVLLALAAGGLGYTRSVDVALSDAREKMVTTDNLKEVVTDAVKDAIQQ